MKPPTRIATLTLTIPVKMRISIISTRKFLIGSEILAICIPSIHGTAVNMTQKNSILGKCAVHAKCMACKVASPATHQ